jgi:hypothetical protein
MSFVARASDGLTLGIAHARSVETLTSHSSDKPATVAASPNPGP